MENNDTWLSPGYCIWTAAVEYVSKWRAYHIDVPTLTMCADDHQLFAAGETHETVESRLKTQGHTSKSEFKSRTNPGLS